MARWTFDRGALEDDARVQEPKDPEPRGGLPDFHPPIKNRTGVQEQLHIELYKLSEAEIFNLVLSTAPKQYVDITRGDGAVLGSDDLPTAAWSALYLARVIAEDRRPLAWLNQARTKLRELADFILGRQCGSPWTSTLLTDTIGTSGPTDTEYGGFVRLEDAPVTLLGSIYSEDIGVCGLALLKTYQVLGDSKYRQGYLAALTCLRRMQQGGKLTIKYATTTNGGDGRYHSGMWAHRMDITDTLGQGGASAFPTDGQGRGGAYGQVLVEHSNSQSWIPQGHTDTNEHTMFLWYPEYGSAPGTRVRITWLVYTQLTAPAARSTVRLRRRINNANANPPLIAFTVTSTSPVLWERTIDIAKPTDLYEGLWVTVQPADSGGGSTFLHANSMVIFLEFY